MVILPVVCGLNRTATAFNPSPLLMLTATFILGPTIFPYVMEKEKKFCDSIKNNTTHNASFRISNSAVEQCSFRRHPTTYATKS